MSDKMPVVIGRLFQFRTKIVSVFYEGNRFVVRPNYNLSLKLGEITHTSTGNRGGISWAITLKHENNKKEYLYCPTGGLPSSRQIDRIFRGPKHLYNNHRMKKVEKRKRFPTERNL